MDLVTSIVVAVVVIVVAFFYFKSQSNSPNITIQSSITDGKKQVNSNVALPNSVNQKEGMAFSYACWMKVDDFSYRYGKQKVVFTKGPEDLSSMCPALFVDANTNSLIVKLDTFGGVETIPIGNIPAKKWLHVVLAVDQDAIDIYINGKLYEHHTLMNIPKQNSDTVRTSVDGGFDGSIASLEYFNYLLKPADVASLAAQPPVPDMTVKDGVGTLPPYFDISWWTRHQ
jgi:hypothetical protein